MRHFIIAGLVALSLMTFAVPVTGMVAQVPASAVGHREGQHESRGAVLDGGEWSWDMMLDRFTIPLDPADPSLCPLRTKEMQWIGVVTD
jgi:hypothetical protein